MNDHDYRQYLQMLRLINIDKLDISAVGNIINSLESLLSQLETADQKWIEQFRSEWGTLEQIYAICVEERKKYLNDQETEWVAQSLTNLKHLIQIALKNAGGVEKS